MTSRNLIFLVALIFYSIFSLTVRADATETPVWTHHAYLDPANKYFLQWKFDLSKQEITFKVEVQTRGWIGFGLSPTGGMGGSDIVLGWVDESNGKLFFHDRHAAEASLPMRDDQQDWQLISGEQNATHTVMLFSRPFVTCDEANDLPIVDDTQRIIYAYGELDPTSIDSIMKHEHGHRGSKSVNLLAKSIHNIQLEEEVETLDLTVKDLVLPAKQTFYWCELFKLNFTSKRHVIKYDATLTPGNEAFTHHFVLFDCAHPDPKVLKKYLNKGFDCTDAARMPPDLLHCTSPIMVWAVGSEPFYLPKQAGYALGPDLDSSFVFLQSHYDNPELVKGVSDSSGLRLWHTHQLREHDAFTFVLGTVPDYRILVPPKQKEFKIVSHCHPECFKKKMPPSGEINMFASFLHAHTIGKTLKLRHFRGDTELPWIDSTDNYDFNFQTFRTLPSPVKLLPGDQLTTECTYDSSKKSKATVGGQASSDEMCNIFISYYPKIEKFKPCYSNLLPSVMMAVSSVEEIANLIPNLPPVITSPRPLKNKTLEEYFREKKDWDKELVAKAQDLMEHSKQRPTCYWLKTPQDEDFDEFIGYPEQVKQIYVPPKRECQRWIIDNEMLLGGENEDLFPNYIRISFVLLIVIIAFAFAFLYYRKSSTFY